MHLCMLIVVCTCRPSTSEHQNSIWQPSSPVKLGCWQPLQLQLDRNHLHHSQQCSSGHHAVSHLQHSCSFAFRHMPQRKPQKLISALKLGVTMQQSTVVTTWLTCSQCVRCRSLSGIGLSGQLPPSLINLTALQIL